MAGREFFSKRLVALALGASAMLGTEASFAAETWELVFSEVNNGNMVYDLFALNPTTAWAVGITTQGSSQSPTGWKTNGQGWFPMALPVGTGGPTEFTIATQIAFLDDNTGWMSGTRVSLAGGQHNLIWRTTTGGMSWDELQEAPDFIEHLQTTPDWAMFAVGGTTLVRTVDGVSFEQLQPPVPSGMELVGLRMFSKDCGYIIASTASDSTDLGSAVLFTGDGGQSWDSRFETREYRLKRAYFVSEAVGWAVGSRGLEGVLAKTTDGGKSWTTSKAPDHPPFFNQVAPVTSCEDVRFFDDQRGVALCLCCTGDCEGGEEAKPSYLTMFLRTADGGQTWVMDPDYEAKMSAPPFPELSKASGMLTMSFPDPNNGFMGGQNNLILRYRALDPEPEGWPPPECGSGGSGGGTSGSGGSGGSGGSSSGASDQADGGSDSGCGCRMGAAPSVSSAWVLGLLALAWIRRVGGPRAVFAGGRRAKAAD